MKSYYAIKFWQVKMESPLRKMSFVSFIRTLMQEFSDPPVPLLSVLLSGRTSCKTSRFLVGHESKQQNNYYINLLNEK